MDQQPPRTLREQAPASPGEQLRAPFSIRRTNELLLDLLAATELVPADRLALVRGAAQNTSLVQALVDEGLVQADAAARALARVTAAVRRPRRAAPRRERVRRRPAARTRAGPRYPIRTRGGRAQDRDRRPTNVHAIDELRLASRHAIELAVASPEQVQDRIRRLVRAAEAYGSRTTESEEGELVVEEDQEDDLELEDGVSDAPLVRLVNSIILQAAEDGASDIHLEPQEDACLVRFRIDGVLQGAAAARSA